MPDPTVRLVRLEKNFGPWHIHYWFPSLKLLFWRSKKVASGATATALTNWVRAVTGKKDTSESEQTFCQRVDHQPDVEDMLVVGLCRHPLARVVSAWHSPFGKCVPFEDFCRQIADCSDDEIDRHLAPQTWHMPEDVNLYRLEEMPASWDAIRNLFHVYHDRPLPPLAMQNKSERRGHLTYYTETTLGLMHERYKADFERLGYD